MASPASAAAGSRSGSIVVGPGGDGHAETPMPGSTNRPRTTGMAGDAETRFRAMVEEHFDFIWRSLRGFGVDSASVDDAAQQVFLIAAQKFDAIADGSQRAFLFATARGIAANARRSVARRREISDDKVLGYQADDQPNPEQLVATTRERLVLDRILAGLPEELCAVFILHELEGMTMSKIADERPGGAHVPA
jgi:RNA polymerase sigma-70 factor (ECF subfamily)